MTICDWCSGKSGVNQCHVMLNGTQPPLVIGSYVDLCRHCYEKLRIELVTVIEKVKKTSTKEDVIT